MEDTDISCSVCGQSFLFSASEQAYYAQRGFQLPKRCKLCRQSRRGRAAASQRLPALRREPEPRPTSTVGCAGCQAPVTVAFAPGERPVYCPACFRARHSA